VRLVQRCSYFLSLPAVCLVQDADFQSIPNILSAESAQKIYPQPEGTQWSTKLKALVKAYISMPVASVDIEHSFSKHGSVM